MKRNTHSTKSDSTSRCIHSTSRGKRCRMLATLDSRYCHSHAIHAKLDTATLAAELSLAAASLATPEDVHRVTAKIFLALCEDRISLKKAGMLSYIAQTLLRAHREMGIHTKLREEERKRKNASANKTKYVLPGLFRIASAMTIRPSIRPPRFPRPLWPSGAGRRVSFYGRNSSMSFYAVIQAQSTCHRAAPRRDERNEVDAHSASAIRDKRRAEVPCTQYNP